MTDKPIFYTTTDALDIYNCLGEVCIEDRPIPARNITMPLYTTPAPIVPHALRILSEKAKEGPYFTGVSPDDDGLMVIDNGRSDMWPVKGEAHEIAFLHAAGEYVRALLQNQPITEPVKPDAEVKLSALQHSMMRAIHYNGSGGCYSYRVFESIAKDIKKTAIRTVVRALARKGLLALQRGYINEEGEARGGSGYYVTKQGHLYLENVLKPQEEFEAKLSATLTDFATTVTDKP